MAPAAGPAIIVAHVNQAMTAEVAVSIRSDREPDPPEKMRQLHEAEIQTIISGYV